MVLLASLVCSGCGTIFARSGLGEAVSGDELPRYYPATYVDFQAMLDVPASKDTVQFILFFDLPISLATDTLLVPYDIFKAPGEEPPPTAH